MKRKNLSFVEFISEIRMTFWRECKKYLEKIVASNKKDLGQ